MEARRTGPVRQRLRRRMTERAGLRTPTDLETATLEHNGRARSYAIAPATTPNAPLLLALHGAGGTGGGMAALTGLHATGPAAGFTVVFPDGVGNVWNDNRGAARLRSREGVDDVAFLAALIAHLATTGRADAARVSLLGISNGALLSEHIARHGRIPVRGVVLVAGAATVASRTARPVPARPTAVCMFEGTADPLVPYAGGPIGFSRLVSRGAGRARPGEPDGRPAPRGVAAAAEDVAADWAAANGAPAQPHEDQVGVPGDLAVTRLTWAATGRPPVVLHRIEGGGHTWPGGAPYLPERIIGPVSRLDASAVALDFLARSG